MSCYLVPYWKAVCRNLGDNLGTSLLNDLELGNCITWGFLITHFLEHLGCAKHCPKNFDSITWLNPHDSRMMSTCFFPVYSYRCTLWGLKRLNNLPKITEPECGAGRDTPQARHQDFPWADHVTSCKPQVTVFLCANEWITQEGCRLASHIRRCICYLRSRGVSRSHILVHLPKEPSPICSSSSSPSWLPLTTVVYSNWECALSIKHSSDFKDSLIKNI